MEEKDSKSSKYLFILLGLIVLILVGEGFYYLHLKRIKASQISFDRKPRDSFVGENKPAETKEYFEDLFSDLPQKSFAFRSSDFDNPAAVSGVDIFGVIEKIDPDRKIISLNISGNIMEFNANNISNVFLLNAGCNDLRSLCRKDGKLTPISVIDFFDLEIEIGSEMRIYISEETGSYGKPLISEIIIRER